MNPRNEESIAYFARTTFRGAGKVFGIKRADRRMHMYLIGKTGTGKTTLLETLLRQDLAARQGFALLDPHGDLVARIRGAVPADRRGDLIDFDVPNRNRPMGFNPLENVPPTRRALVAAGLLEAFKKIWADSWGPRLEHILRNALLTLLDQPQATMADILRLLDDPLFRTRAVTKIQNPQVKAFWIREYANYPQKFQAEAIAPIQNKVGAFLADPVLHAILTQPRSTFDVRQVMDEGKILLVNLAKGQIGEHSAALLGALLVATVGHAALGRADQPEAGRRDFFVYLDEFPLFTTGSLASMLSELRKYGVGLILAHQFLTQIELPVRDAILGNVGTIIAFRLGLPDAEILAREFAPVFSVGDLIALPNHQICLKLLIDGVVSEPFSAETVAPPEA